MPEPPSATPPAPPPILWRALALDRVQAGDSLVVALAGGGGKTTLLYRLGREAAALGRRSVLCGTARFTRPRGHDDVLVIAVADEAHLPARIAEAWASGDATPIVASGVDPERAARLVRISPATVEAIARLDRGGVVFIEADGARMLPFKAPGEDEPVIPACATHVVAVVGVDALDAPLDAAHVHRPERVRAICDRPTCDAELIARVLASPRGGRQHAGERPFAVVVNKADLDPAGALRLAERIAAAGVPRVVVAALADEADPVRSVIERAR